MRSSTPEELADDAMLDSLIQVGGASASEPQDDDAAFARALQAAQEATPFDAFGINEARLLPLFVQDVADAFRGAVRLPKAEIVAGGFGIGDLDYQLHCPLGVVSGNNGSIIIADTGNYRVMRWKKGADHGEMVAGGGARGTAFEPVDVALSTNGSLFVSVSGPDDLRSVELWPPGAPDGIEVARGSFPTGLALEDDCLLFADTFNNMISRCFLSEDVPWRQVTIAGTSTRPLVERIRRLEDRTRPAPKLKRGLRADEFRRPFGIALTPNGDVLVADSGHHRVVRWSRESRKCLVVAGGRGQGSSLSCLNYPRGVVAEGADAILVADTFNHRVVRWRFGAKCGELVAGGGPSGGRFDQLSSPVGLALDAKGNLLIADSRNHRIVRVNLEAQRTQRPPLRLGPAATEAYAGLSGSEAPWAKEALDTIRDQFHPTRSGMDIDEIFSRLERLESGVDALSLVEFDRILRTYRPELNLHQVRQLFTVVNTSGSGRISREEFRRRFGAVMP